MAMFHHGQACCFCHGDHELMVLLGSFDGLPQCSPVNNLLRRFSYLFKHNIFNLFYLLRRTPIFTCGFSLMYCLLSSCTFGRTNLLVPVPVIEYRYQEDYWYLSLPYEKGTVGTVKYSTIEYNQSTVQYLLCTR